VQQPAEFEHKAINLSLPFRKLVTNWDRLHFCKSVKQLKLVNVCDKINRAEMQRDLQVGSTKGKEIGVGCSLSQVCQNVVNIY